jgi:hypothetical protein
MSPKEDKMEQEVEYKKALATLNELEKLCLDENSLAKVRCFSDVYFFHLVAF